MKSKQKQTPTEIIDNQRQAVVEKIIEDMKRDGLRWAEPYLPSLTPHNPVSGTVYQGGNRVHLGFIGFMRGYTDNRWATFNQIKDAGWHVKKGAKSALIEKWKQFAFYKENEDTGEKELGKNIEIDAPELEEEVSLAGESHDMVSASEHQTESEMPEPALAAIL